MGQKTDPLLGPQVEHVVAGHRHQYAYHHEVKAMSFEDRARHVSFHMHNKLWPNGRINLGYDENGELIANSISPYADGFDRNIEKKIKDLVGALRSKRYLTYSSCQGHTYENRRYVGIAFADEESRDRFTRGILKLNLFGVSVRPLDTVSNQQTMVSDGPRTTTSSTNVKGLEPREQIKSNTEAQAFNIMFQRNYESYCFAELIILQEKPSWAWFKSPLLSLQYLYLKMFRWDQITQIVTDGILDKAFPTYRF